MNKHTKGPWKLDPVEYVIMAQPDGPRAVAQILIGSMKPTEEEHANANLIEAAPDLKETVRWMAQTIHQAHHMDQPGTFLECPKNTCRAAADALAKSEGRAQ